MSARSMLLACSLLLVTALPASAQDLSCEEELVELEADLAAHGAKYDGDTADYATCEDEFEAASAELDAIHAEEPVVTQDAPERQVCLQYCSCGVCLSWGERGVLKSQDASEEMFSS